MTLIAYLRRFVLRFRLQIAATDLAMLEKMLPNALEQQRQHVADLEQRLERAERALEQGDAHA